MASLPPKLGPFEPLSRLGAGGMAETFLAVRRGPSGFEQRVCIKRILPAYEDDQEFVESFLVEARTSAALRHANIVQVVDFGQNESDGSHYLALELVDGMDLRALMSREGPLDPELVTLIASELASALAHAHSEDEGRPSVVHRDLSPSNVLVSRAGEVKLTDFGIARVIGGAHRTASGVIKGKVPYMPPEYVDGGRFDARGDLFSLGVMLYELCHGQRPFDGDSELDTMRRIASGERRPFTVPASPSFVACVDRLLLRQPEARFPSALALLDALPALSVHHTRKRLSALVRGRPSTPDGAGLAGAGSAGKTPTPFQRTVASPPARESAKGPTRTSVLTHGGGPSKVAWLALAGALVVLVSVAGLALFKNLQPKANVALVPSLPTLSRAPGSTPRTTQPDAVGPSPEHEHEHELEAESATDPEGSSLVREAVRFEPAEPMEPAPRASGRRTSHEATAKPSPATSRSSAELRVVVYPFGDVWVDDKYAGQSPLSLHLSAGTHEIAVGEGRARERRTVRLRAGENESLTFRSPPTRPL